MATTYLWTHHNSKIPFPVLYESDVSTNKIGKWCVEEKYVDIFSTKNIKHTFSTEQELLEYLNKRADDYEKNLMVSYFREIFMGLSWWKAFCKFNKMWLLDKE